MKNHRVPHPSYPAAPGAERPVEPNALERGFTLIELLIVIAIIGILMALLFPAVGSAIDAARRTQAKNDVVQLAAAITAYDTEYGYLPPSIKKGSNPVDKSLIETLTGSPNAVEFNPRRITFMEVSPYKRGKSGTNGDGQFVDPWALTEGGDKKSTYFVAIDTGGDNITAGGTNMELVNKRILCWNDPALSTSDVKKRSRRYVTSWD